MAIESEVKEKKTSSTRKKKAVAAAPDAAKTFTLDEVNEITRKAVEEALAAVKEGTDKQKATIEVTEQSVSLVLMYDCNRDNTIYFGKFGAVYGKCGHIEVPKIAFGGEFMTPLVRKLLDERSLVVVDGLTEDERYRYGVHYKDGEVLTEDEYYHILDMDEETVCKRFSEVCENFRTIIASEYADKRNEGDPRVKRETVERLNEISKKINAARFTSSDIRRNGAFYYTLMQMGIVHQ